MNKLIICLAFAVMVLPASAQLNLKKKFERKADQVVDDLLFGKKSKNDNSSSSSSSSPGSSNESYESEDKSAPNGGYVRKPVDYSRMNTGEVVHFRDLIDFLPDNVGGFSLADEPDGASMRFGEYSYSYAAKKYNSGDEEMTIMIYDYLFTGIFGAYANAYEYETTDGMMKSIEVDGYPGWFSTTYDSGTTQMMLVVNNRFMININRNGASESELRGYTSNLDLTRLPEGPPMEEEPDDDQGDDSDK